jgi:sugar lactone lactonase YvrE
MLSVGSTTTRGSRRRRLEAEWFGIDADVGEGPVWLGQRAEIASIDVTGQRLHLLSPESGMDEVIDLPMRVNAAMPGSASTIVLAADSSLHAWHLDDRVLRPMVQLPGRPPVGTRFNDGKVDSAGRIWIGARTREVTAGSGTLLSWESGRAPEVRVGGLTGPNGLAWNVAGDRLYLADSRERRIHRYRFDQALGSASDGVEFASWSEKEGRPDGLTVDVDDHLWCAAWDAGCIRRYDPLGRLVQTVVLPAIRLTSCAFGGPGLDRLWVTSARAPDPDQADLGGGVFAIEVGRVGRAPAVVPGMEGSTE